MKKLLLFITVFASMLILTGCDKDIQIFRTKETPGVQVPVKADALEMNSYYVKDGTSFILTLPLKGSGKSGRPENSISKENLKRVLYAGPYEDTLIPTHYKGEIVAQASRGAQWDDVFLERYKDMGYSVGFYNATYDQTENSLNFSTSDHMIKGTSLAEAFADLESQDIRVVEVNHNPLSPDNADFDSGILINMQQGETYTLSFYSGTYYHEMDVVADTQMFQSYELYSYSVDYISDTPNGYRCFNTPSVLKSGYYAIDGWGLFRYVDYEKGGGNVENTDYNEPYYDSDADKLANFSKQFSFTVDTRTKNLTVLAYYDEYSIENEASVEGYIFAPDGTEFYMNVDHEENAIWTAFSQAMPGKWTVNIVPQNIGIESFDAVDNTPDQALTQEVFNFTLESDRENVIFKTPFTNSVADENVADININGTMIAPDGETYILEVEEEEELDGSKRLFLVYRMAYAPAGEYTITVNHYPERTTVYEPQITNNTESVTETIVVDG